jgi:hypothetical protein
VKAASAFIVRIHILEILDMMQLPGQQPRTAHHLLE